jgi:hypothetical protein
MKIRIESIALLACAMSSGRCLAGEVTAVPGRRARRVVRCNVNCAQLYVCRNIKSAGKIFFIWRRELFL